MTSKAFEKATCLKDVTKDLERPLLKPFFLFSESETEHDFGDALAFCLNQQQLDYWNGLKYGLVGVGQLRKFRNRFDYADGVQRRQFYFDDQRMFRVNARKGQDGVWREFLSGVEVQFHHYPGFEPRSGKAGDTIVWDSKTNRLYVANPKEKFHVLCTTRRADGKNTKMLLHSAFSA